MKSGKKVLKELNRTLKDARSHLDEIDHELETSAQALALNTRSQARTLRRIAQLRLEAMGRGELDTALEAADREAVDALEKRERAIAMLEEDIEQAQQALDRLEQERDELHDAVEAAARKVTECEAAAQTRLETDPNYTTQLNAVRELDAQADA